MNYNKTKQTIAIFLDSKPTSGGAYQEQASLLNRIIKNNKDRFKIVFICLNGFNFLSNELKKNHEVFNLNMNFFDRYIAYLRNFSILVRRFKKFFFFRNKFEILLEDIKADLVFFLGPSQFAMYLENTNFVITVPDISHKEDLEFPEWTKLKTSEYNRRDEILNNTVPKALAVITNAEYIKKKISFYYRVNEKRIHIINQQPSEEVSKFNVFSKEESKKIKAIYALPEFYLFYPAMFLTHKNHTYLIDALELIREKINMHLVFCGSDKGFLNNIKSYTKNKKLENYVNFLDFVKNEELPYLYKNSFALAMPTYSGPTNIPPWEAFKLGIPVFYSNLEGAFDVYKDAVYYIDIFDPNSLAEGVIDLFNNKEKKQELVQKGTNLLLNTDIDKEFDDFFIFLEQRIKKIKVWKFD